MSEKLKTGVNEDNLTLGLLKNIVPVLIEKVDKLEAEVGTFESFKKRLILLLLDLK